MGSERKEEVTPQTAYRWLLAMIWVGAAVGAITVAIRNPVAVAIGVGLTVGAYLSAIILARRAAYAGRISKRTSRLVAFGATLVAGTMVLVVLTLAE